MNDKVARLMALADNAIAAQEQLRLCDAEDYRKALQDELTKLFEPVVEPVAHATVRPLQPDECERKVIIKWANQPVAGPLFASQPPAEVPLLTDDQYQSEFEAFVNAELGDVAVTDQGRYISPKIQNYWRVWQAAIQKAGIK